MSTVIWWLRRDLRLADNQALQAALEAGDRVIPVFILDERLLRSAGVAAKRLEFLFGALKSVDADLRDRGSRLIVRRGRPEVALAQLLDESSAGQIVAEPDTSPFAMCRDQAVAARLPITWAGSPVVHPPETILKPNGKPFTVFSAFRKAWLGRPLPAGGLSQAFPNRPESLPGVPPAIASEPLPEATGECRFPASEAEAQRRLAGFLGGEAAPVYSYAENRNRLDLDGTSQLSPYLRFGLLSARQVVASACNAIQAASDPAAAQSAQVFLDELIWREFYVYILAHYPQVLKENFRLKSVAWVNNPAHFDAWRLGQTGYPVIDAAMRQLAATGWMHNRARMLVASFLTKHLLIDWRWGEGWFREHLIDGDPAANNGGWQWTAGTGTDAAPYFRIFNPSTQSARWDPQGKFIRRWLPELAKVPAEFIHMPWQMPAEIQSASDCLIGQDYPAPVVDHAWARERALAVYGRSK